MKKARLMPKLIGTHSGTFHADEALAVALLRSLPTYKDADLVRTRDPAKLEPCDIVVDVGGVYDDKLKRYDHHQRGFSEVFGHGFKTKLSSAGLIYKHYGPEIIANHLDIPAEDARIPTLYLRLYEEFVEALDGIDNGISQYVSTAPDVKTQALYKSRTDLSSRVGKLNPAWNEPYTDDILDAQFAKASTLAGTEFFQSLQYVFKAWLPARDIVLKALESRPAEFEERVIVFDQSAPWKEHLFQLEKELNTTQVLYIVYPEGPSPTSKWRIQCVPQSPDSFENRKGLPEPWRGLRDDELSAKTGVKGCIFIHAAGFIGGCQTKEGVLQLAKLALQS